LSEVLCRAEYDVLYITFFGCAAANSVSQSIFVSIVQYAETAQTNITKWVCFPYVFFNLILWVLPFVLVALAAISIYFLIRRWSARIRLPPVAHLDEDQLSGYEERLEKELKQFDEGF